MRVVRARGAVSALVAPTMNLSALSPVEAVSVTALLEDCCEKLAFLGTISPDVTEHKAEESNRVRAPAPARPRLRPRAICALRDTAPRPTCA